MTKKITFNFEKSTPGTHRYKEVEVDGEPLMAKTIYIKKDFLIKHCGNEEAPAKIQIAFSVDEAAKQ